MLATIDEIAREAAKAKREFPAEVEKSAEQGEECAENEERAAEFAKIHKDIIEETPATVARAQILLAYIY